VTFAVRIGESQGRPVEVRVALPPDTPAQRLSDLRIVGRGLTTQVIQGEHPEVLLTGVVRKSRRVAVSYTVTVEAQERTVPLISPPDDPSLDLYTELSPAPLFPSRSILVREFLEESVGPVLAEGNRGVMRAIYNVARRRFEHKTKGKSLPLDVLRRGYGQRIGLERLFTTFLRCARIPARFVEGIDLDSRTKRKRVFWTEAWAKEEWWPVSLSRRWLGKRSSDLVALTYDGRRAVQFTGEGTVTYTVQAHARTDTK
jgi:transglutaminase-like putative cysteine protease